MHVSAHTRSLASEVTPRTQKRRPPAYDTDGNEIRRVSERPEDGRRQGNIWRRPRAAARARDQDDQSAKSPTRHDALIMPPLPESMLVTDFWALISAVHPGDNVGGPGKASVTLAGKPPEPTLDDLFARVMAAG